MNYIVFDTETTNGFDDPICYDVGWAVFNDSGAVLQTRSFVIADIFLDEPRKPFLQARFPNTLQRLQMERESYAVSRQFVRFSMKIVRCLMWLRLWLTICALITEAQQQPSDG